MRRKLGFLLVFASLIGSAAGLPLTVRLVSSLPSPQPVGTPIGCSPQIDNVAKGTHVFRYEAGAWEQRAISPPSPTIRIPGSPISTTPASIRRARTPSRFSIIATPGSRRKTSQARGQQWKLDEKSMTATLVHNAKLQFYSPAVGAAQTLKNSGYSFNIGYIDNLTSPRGRAAETDRDGRAVFALDVYGISV
ncbi:MAG TPA: hypothetical protein VMT15_19470 [Bryobacteraceae bacterium]|nr:hypothetical protein [Bryobacteraceae bacterium]